jgi:hypothetical protein
MTRNRVQHRSEARRSRHGSHPIRANLNLPLVGGGQAVTPAPAVAILEGANQPRSKIHADRTRQTI